MDDLAFHERMREAILDWLDDGEEELKKMFNQQQKITQEVLNMSKTYWLNTMGMASAFQEQNEKMWNLLLDEGLITQQKGKRMFQKWINGAKQAREQFQKIMEDNGKNLEVALVSSSEVRPNL